MVDGATAERVHALLKDAVLTGGVSMYERLDLAELATAFGVSTTPVREAAMRLLGAGLLEPHPKGGLRVVVATETRLRALLDVNERLVASALAFGSPSTTRMIADEPDRRAETRSRGIFRAIAERSENAAMVDLMERVSDRLARYRHRELAVFDDLATELDGLELAFRDPAALRKATRRYHRRRLLHAAELVWAVTAFPDETSGQPAGAQSR